MRASTKGRLRMKQLEKGNNISDEFLSSLKRRWIRTCADEETTLHCNVFGHKSCYIISGTMGMFGSAMIEKDRRCKMTELTG